MQFEKWQALGNDYLIIEERELPFELSPPRVRRLCAPHTGVGSDGVLLLAPPLGGGSVARLRIFNADGSEAELSGNGAREAVLYLRRRAWTDRDAFSIETPAGEIRARVTEPAMCTIDMGKARVVSADFPGGPDDGSGTLSAAGRSMRFQHVMVGNPQCAVEVAEELEELDLGALGPPIENHELFPNRTNVSFWRRDAARAITARIFERGVGETLSSGTGAVGAAVAAVVGGGVSSPVTVHLEGGDLEVRVGKELEVELTGWAVPVYSGALSEELLEELGRL